MPNGDRNIWRLVFACAEYAHRFDAWPQTARLGPSELHELAGSISPDDFQKVADKLTLTTQGMEWGLIVHGPDGEVDYGRHGASNKTDVDERRVMKWLGLDYFTERRM